jgi:hypothetical protein
VIATDYGTYPSHLTAAGTFDLPCRPCSGPWQLKFGDNKVVMVAPVCMQLVLCAGIDLQVNLDLAEQNCLVEGEFLKK